LRAHQGLLERVRTMARGAWVVVICRAQPPEAACRESPRFKVHVLGRFRLMKADIPIGRQRSVQPKPIELLQALIGFGGTEVGAGKLIDALWPDADGDAGYHALETTLYRLRRVLGSADAVQMSNNKLSLDRKQFWVDLWELERALEGPGATASDRAARLADAHRLYEGHFLEHEAEKSWALDVRQTLRDKILRRARQAARLYEAERRWDQAQAVYRTALELDETAEDLHRGLMVCQRELGEHSEVLRSYSRCRDLLMRSLGVLPDARTQAICGGLKHKTPAAGAGELAPQRRGACAPEAVLEPA